MDGIAAAGYNRSFPRAILHAPSKYYGLNLTDMHTEQGLELGILDNPFTQDYTTLNPLVTNSWIKTVSQHPN